MYGSPTTKEVKKHSPDSEPRQRNMAQMKEQIKIPEKDLSDEKIDNLSDAEFKTLCVEFCE